jgi:hypothetical protein
MVMSSLARKVYGEVKLLETIKNIEWVETRLQTMKINGLVMMINKSKKQDDIKYIDGYLPKYKWASRPDGVDISGHLWAVDFMQSLTVDFPWGYWSNIITIAANEVQLFYESIKTAVTAGPGNLPYAWAVFVGKKQALLHTKQLVSEAVNKAKSVPVRQVEELPMAVRFEWADIRDRI